MMFQVTQLPQLAQLLEESQGIITYLCRSPLTSPEDETNSFNGL